MTSTPLFARNVFKNITAPSTTTVDPQRDTLKQLRAYASGALVWRVPAFHLFFIPNIRSPSALRFPPHYRVLDRNQGPSKRGHQSVQSVRMLLARRQLALFHQITTNSAFQRRVAFLFCRYYIKANENEQDDEDYLVDHTTVIYLVSYSLSALFRVYVGISNCPGIR